MFSPSSQEKFKKITLEYDWEIEKKQDIADDEILRIDGCDSHDDTSEEERDVFLTGRQHVSGKRTIPDEKFVRHARKSPWLLEPNRIK